MKKFIPLIVLLVFSLSVTMASPTVQFVVASSTSNEAVTSFSIAVSISNPDANPTSVDITVMGGGSATSGADYSYSPVTLTFPANSQVVEFVTVDVVNDLLIEGDENFTFALNNPTNNASIGALSQHVVTITDNDALTVDLVSGSLTQYENIGQVNLQVRLSTASANATSVTVHLDVPRSTATPVTDFTFTDTTVTWLPDSSGIVFVPIQVIDDALFEPTETVRVTLTNPTNGAALGNDTFLLSVLNNDSLFFADCADLFFTEYLHGSDDDKAMEVFNPTQQVVDMSEYSAIILYNGGDSVRQINLTGTVAPGDVYIFAKTGARPVIASKADMQSNLFNWDGNDAILLLHFDDTIDVFGQLRFDPGLGFGMDYGSTWYNNYCRKKNVYHGDYHWNYGVHTWNFLGTDFNDSLGAHHMYPCGSPVPKASVKFAEPFVTYAETHTGPIPIIVELDNLSEGQVSYRVGHNNNLSSATFLADYQAPVNDFTHGPGLWKDTVWATIYDDQLVEPTETAVIYLTNFNGYGGFVTDSVFYLNITDNDVPTLSFNGAGFSYVEDTNLVLVKITLSGAQDSITPVQISLAPGNATRNVDFVFNDTTVYFPANSMDTMGVWVRIINDTIVEPNEQINLNLVNTDSTLFKGIIAYTLTIIDDDFVSGIGEAAWGEGIKIYPNPVVNQLTIETETDLTQVTITGVMGNSLYAIDMLPIGKNSIDLSALPAGMFYVTVSRGQNTYSKRFIKVE